MGGIQWETLVVQAVSTDNNFSYVAIECLLPFWNTLWSFIFVILLPLWFTIIMVLVCFLFILFLSFCY